MRSESHAFSEFSNAAIASGVLSASKGSDFTSLSPDELLRVEKRAVRGCLHLAQHCELEFDEDRAWNVLCRSCFGEEGIERFVSPIVGLVAEYSL